MSGKRRFYDLVKKGREGANKGLSTGLPKMETYIDGLLPGTSYLIGAQSGVGKSTFALYTFVYKPLMDYLEGIHEVDRDPIWCIFNLEMTQEQIYAKLVSMYIYEKWGDQLTFKEIFSRGKEVTLSDEHYELLLKCDEFLDVLDTRMRFFDEGLDHYVYHNKTEEVLSEFGEFDINGNYTPKDPNKLIVFMIDHMSLIRANNPKGDKKVEMDLISDESVEIRNKTNCSHVHIMQFNRGANGQERLKQGLQEPDSSDFKDSGTMYEASQIVLALHSPIKFKLTSYRGYNIKELAQNFISCILLKTRFGTSDIAVGLGFYGDCSTYKELPKSNEITDYEKYKTPYWSLEDTNNEEDTHQVTMTL